jgi:hypothetical protein
MPLIRNREAEALGRKRELRGHGSRSSLDSGTRIVEWATHRGRLSGK